MANISIHKHYSYSSPEPKWNLFDIVFPKDIYDSRKHFRGCMFSMFPQNIHEIENLSYFVESVDVYNEDIYVDMHTALIKGEMQMFIVNKKLVKCKITSFDECKYWILGKHDDLFIIREFDEIH